MKWPKMAFCALSCCVAFAQSAGSPPQTEPHFVPAPGQRYYLDLDSADGRGSRWRLDDIRNLCVLHATIRIPRVGKDIRARPDFWIQLQNDAPDAESKRVGIELWTQTHQAPLDIRVFQYYGSDMMTSESSSVRLSQDVDMPVVFVWMPDRSVVIRIGQTELHHLKVSWPIERIGVGSGNGEMIVNPLVLGCIEKTPQS
jgi:hypothetical protein